MGVHKALAEEFRRKPEVQETRFCKQCDELKGEADGLKEKLAAADAQATARLSYPSSTSKWKAFSPAWRKPLTRRAEPGGCNASAPRCPKHLGTVRSWP